MVAQSAFRLPGGLRVVPPAALWLAGGVALMLAGLWFESSPLARALAPDPARLTGAGHVMHWYWVPLVVIAGVLI